MRKVIGVAGWRGAGKDTIANFLVTHAGFKRIGFADRLYQEVAQAFDVTVEFLSDRKTKEQPLPELALINCKDPDASKHEGFVAVFLATMGETSTLDSLKKPRSPREILQVWGTDYRRKMFSETYWVDSVRQTISKDKENSYVISDVRFVNEAEVITSLGGTMIKVIRPSQESERKKSKAHESDVGLKGLHFDHEFINEEGTEGLEKLRKSVLDLFEPLNFA